MGDSGHQKISDLVASLRQASPSLLEEQLRLSPVKLGIHLRANVTDSVEWEKETQQEAVSLQYMARAKSGAMNQGPERRRA